MDNAKFHKSKEINDLIESKGATLLFLPKYSPDFNPIESFWGTLKQFIRKHQWNNPNVDFLESIFLGFLKYS